MFWSMVGQLSYFWTCKAAEHHGVRAEWSKAVIDFMGARRDKEEENGDGRGCWSREGSPDLAFKTISNDLLLLLDPTPKISTIF